MFKGIVMQLTVKEKEVLCEFKRLISAEFPGEILKVMIFGSKARGDASIESDIDVIVVTSFDDWQ